jgi:hypothetical protein
VGACPIPDSLKDEGFPEAWADWVAYRDELGESLTSYTSRQVLLKCERWGPKRAVVLIRRAIGNSWKNIRDDHELNHGPGGKPPGPPAKPRPPDKSPAWMHDARKVRDFLNGDQSLTDEQARALVLGFPSDFSVVWFADAQHRNWVKSVLREKA